MLSRELHVSNSGGFWTINASESSRYFVIGRPFSRRLPEFQFWLSSQRGLVMAFGMTFLSIFDIPVFWPILLMYFIVLMVGSDICIAKYIVVGVALKCLL